MKFPDHSYRCYGALDLGNNLGRCNAQRFRTIPRRNSATFSERLSIYQTSHSSQTFFKFFTTNLDAAAPVREDRSMQRLFKFAQRFVIMRSCFKHGKVKAGLSYLNIFFNQNELLMVQIRPYELKWLVHKVSHV